MPSEISKTILQQLGGGKFITMTGSRNFLSLLNGVSFKIGAKTKNKASYCRIELNNKDLYTMTFLKKMNLHTVEIKKVEDIYSDQLEKVFTAETGLDTKL